MQSGGEADAGGDGGNDNQVTTKDGDDHSPRHGKAQCAQLIAGTGAGRHLECEGEVAPGGRKGQ